MGYTNPDVYYNPEKFDLTTVGQINWFDECYEYHMTVVWEHKDGTLYWASDNGCSCSSPFESYTSLDSLETGTKWDLIAAVQQTKSEYSFYSAEAAEYANNQVTALIERVVLG